VGTNFYIRESSIDNSTGEVVYEDIHIGKRSGGWVFTFNGQVFRSVVLWRAATRQIPANMQIVDEYGDPHTYDDFWDSVEQTKKPWGPRKIRPQINAYSQFEPRKSRQWVDEGFAFYNGEFS